MLFASIGNPVIAQDMENGLSKRQQSIIPIAAFTAKGDLENLSVALNNGLDAGLSISEVKEVLTHLYAYTGFPRSLNGINTLMKVLDERKAKDIQDNAGKDADPMPDGKSSYELGKEVQTRLSGAPVKGGAMDFAPAIDYFLKAHLFGDLFADIADVLKEKVGRMEAYRADKVISAAYEQKFTMGKPIEDVFPKGRVSTADYFTGTVWNQRLVSGDSISHCQTSNVTFEAGARTRWHIHTGTQILLCTAGEGWYQEQGEQARKLGKGDVVVIRPGVEHWHGASAKSEFSHLSVIPNPENNKDTERVQPFVRYPQSRKQQGHMAGRSGRNGISSFAYNCRQHQSGLISAVVSVESTYPAGLASASATTGLLGLRERCRQRRKHSRKIRSTVVRQQWCLRKVSGIGDRAYLIPDMRYPKVGPEVSKGLTLAYQRSDL